MNARTRNCAGLIMVEAALAVVVLAIGVLAVFALFSTGLDTRAKASGDTQAALFADGVFNALRVESAAASEQDLWETFWSQLEDGTTNMPMMDGMWASNMLIHAGGLHTNIYSIVVGVATTAVDHALRYQMDVRHSSPASRVEVTLKVWEGVFGRTNDNDAAVFYTEFDDPGDL